jgi:hypothetical protein
VEADPGLPVHYLEDYHPSSKHNIVIRVYLEADPGLPVHYLEDYHPSSKHNIVNVEADPSLPASVRLPSV